MRQRLEIGDWRLKVNLQSPVSSFFSIMLKRTITLVLILLVIGLGASASAQEPNRAGLVVVLADGTAVTRCVEFAEDEINGLELLNRSGLAMETGTASFGTSVCRIEETGCPGNDCFCQCKGGDCVYWSYWHWRDNGWQYSQAGAGIYQVKNGAVEGWTWGPGTPQDAPEPPAVTFDEICAAPVVVPTEVSEAIVATTAVEPTIVATAVPAPQPAASGPTQWLGYAFLGLIVVGLGGLLLVKGRKAS